VFVIVFSILEFVLQLEVCRFTQRDNFSLMYECVWISQLSASRQNTAMLLAKDL